ncbi:MAG TPA: S41 family peptidase [Terriglobia bacterium]|nr:S41 family peptidase [Terriglobia bacterium]
MQLHRPGHAGPSRWTDLFRRGELPVVTTIVMGALSAALLSLAGRPGVSLAQAAADPAAAAAADSGPGDDPVAASATEVARVYAALEANAIDPVDPDHVILDGGIRQALATLDPFSSFFDSDQFRQLQEQQRGEAVGFGSILYVQEGKVLVISVAPESPSARAGLGPGDEIVEVNGTRIAGLDFRSLIGLLQQARGKPVRLGVIHPGKVVSQDYELKPAELNLPTVDKIFMLRPGIGYLHIASFESNTPEEVSKALARLQKQAASTSSGSLQGSSGMAAKGGARKSAGSGAALGGVLLDLRDNHGGQVQAAIGVASIFLPKGLSVLTVRGRAQPPQTFRTAEPPENFQSWRGPLVVLVNGETASASEVLAAALEEHDRAVVAGEPTYGKGVVQNVMPLSDNTGLALTVAQYFTPSGRSIQRPIPGTSLEDMAPSRTGETTGFRTDDGRALAAGGGVTPDVILPAPDLDPWVQFLDQRGAFTEFADQYRDAHSQISHSFQPDDQVLGDFQDFLHRSGVRTPENYWERDHDYLELRIRTEVMNLVYGVAAGDEVATKADPQVQSAEGLFPRIPELLKPAASSQQAYRRPDLIGRRDRRLAAGR